MLRRTLLPIVVLVACAGGDQNPPGVSGLAESASGSGSTGSPTTGISVGSTDDASATATTAVDPDASTSAGSVGESSDASSSSDSSGVTEQSWRRYSLDTAMGTWSDVALSEIWSGANAPPSTGIAAAVSFTHFERLFVVTEDGTVYEQADGVWQTPVPLSERFPAAGELQVTAMTHTPGQEADDREDIFFIDAPTAVVYTQFENGGLELAAVSTLMDQKNGAPQASVDNDWTLAIADPSGIGQDPDWLQWYGTYGDALWLFNAAFEWTPFPLDDNPFFSGAPGEPDPTTVRAAYYDDAFERAHFIAP